MVYIGGIIIQCLVIITRLKINIFLCYTRGTADCKMLKKTKTDFFIDRIKIYRGFMNNWPTVNNMPNYLFNIFYSIKWTIKINISSHQL